jgi:phosphoglycerate dehydrogenase-like enzyme
MVRIKTMAKVLIAPMTLANVEGEFLDVLRQAGLELVYPHRAEQMNETELLEALIGIDASLAGSEPYSARVLAAHPHLRVIARVGVGYDAVDVAAATARGVVVTYAPNTNQGSVAEHTFCLLLGLTRGLVTQHGGVKSGNWPRGTNLPLRTRTLGLVGLGRIGKAVATRALAFEMKVIAHDPFPDKNWAASHGVRLLPLEELMKEADFVSLHMPATPASTHLINRRTLSLMKPTAFLINTARGAVVFEPDLVAALMERRIAGAALDVFDQEPLRDHPFQILDNVLLTPHAAGMDLRSRDDMAKSAAESIAALWRGEWPAEKVVNPQVKGAFRWRKST